jgi:N-acetylmuramoyl-L-alanine amidase
MQINRYFLLVIFIIGYGWFSQGFFLSPFGAPQKTIKIMLDPAGDAQNSGRAIDDSFERSITWHYCYYLQKALEAKFSDVKVIITRQPGEAISELQNANFANRLNVDLFLNINFFQETSTKTQFFMYTYSNNDDFITQKSEMMFYRYDHVHQYNAKNTHIFAHAIKQSLDTQEFKQKFECKDIIKCPFKPLVGIKAPAIAFEIGLKKKEDWQLYVEPMVTSIETLIVQYLQKTT